MRRITDWDRRIRVFEGWGARAEECRFFDLKDFPKEWLEPGLVDFSRARYRPVSLRVLCGVAQTICNKEL